MPPDEPRPDPHEDPPPVPPPGPRRPDAQVQRALTLPLMDARATVTLLVASAVLSVLDLRGADLGMLQPDPETWPANRWSLVTTNLLHGGTWHLALNVLAMVYLGRRVEGLYGTTRTALFYLLVGTASMAAEWAVSRSPVGLSGIAYGCVGLLWALDRWHPDKRGVLPPGVGRSALSWFALCILLTASGALAIANWAHGAGGLLGILLGWSLSGPRDRRGWRWFAFPVACLALIAAGMFGRPLLNRSPSYALELFHRGLAASRRNDLEQALAAYTRATELLPEFAEAWWNRGVCLQNLGRTEESRAAFARALELDPEMGVGLGGR